MKNNKTLLSLLICFMIGFLLVSCGCNKINYKSYSDVKASLDTVFVDGTEEINIKTRKANFANELKTHALQSFEKYKNDYVELKSITDANDQTTSNKINELKNSLNTEISTILNGTYTETELALNVGSTLEQHLNELAVACTMYLKPTEGENTEANYRVQTVETIKDATLVYYLVLKAKSEVLTIVKDEEYDDFQQMLFEQDRNTYNEKLNAIDTTIEASEITDGKTYDGIVIERSKEVYALMEEFSGVIAKRSTQPEPIRFQLTSVNDFFANFFDNFLVYPVGFLLVLFSKLFGGNYIFGLLITTLIIRTIGWPIYAKSNDMTLKMKLMEPEQAKIQEKYARRKDEESQRMMQMEMMQLYKKYKIGLGGCLMPFLQFPIFMAVFRAVSRLPYTTGFAGSPDWVSSLNTKVFGVDLFNDRTVGGTPQLIGIIVLCILVVGTQVLQQLLANKKQREAQEKAQADVPAYRRQSVQQNNQMQQQMKIMMWTMTGMMGVFVFTSAAGLGVYWLIGNLYAIAQQYINSKTSEKRLEKLKQKHSR